MNLLATAPYWLIILLTLTLVAAAVEDMLRLRISNVTCLVVAVLAVAAMVVSGPTLGLWQNVAGFVLLLVLGTFAFSAGLVGGGDVKLLAALLLWVDLMSALGLLAAILIGGGLVAVAFLFVSLLAGAGFKNSRKRRIPYGVPIAAGALITIGFARDMFGG